jgi:hypothetical protein
MFLFKCYVCLIHHIFILSNKFTLTILKYRWICVQTWFHEYYLKIITYFYNLSFIEIINLY